ncbi:unnamed protein product, partial [Iphiclides podalirius]
MMRPLLILNCLFISQALFHPLYHPTERTPLAAVNELTSRLSAHPSRLQEPRLPPNIETIKKVAQILIMLGEQVIPGVIGEPPPHAAVPSPSEDIPNDPVADR